MDLLEISIKELRRRQLTSLREEMPEAFEGHSRRMSEATMVGMRIVNERAHNAARLQTLIVDLITVAERDPRFAFLGAIPEAPILSMTRALALERSIFGEETHQVAELSLLMGLFTVILDGLLDEAPSELQALRSWLDKVMEPSRWEVGGMAVPALGISDHPVTEALGWLTCEVIDRLILQDGWIQDPLVRQQFFNATRAAYSSELESADCRITDRTMPLTEARRRILAKSTNPIWAGSLIPFCVHGWPAQIDPDEFTKLAHSIGVFGGWLDDIVDVGVDLRSDRWSMVLFELNDIVQSFPAQPASGDLRPAIVNALRIPFIAGQLAFMGVNRLKAIRAGLISLRLEEVSLLPVVADVAEACLTDGMR